MKLLFPRNQRHSITYYSQVLRVLLAGVNARQRQAAMADALNAADLPSSTGAEWDAEKVKAVLKRLRARSGPHWHALLEICFDGSMTPAQARPLLQVL